MGLVNSIIFFLLLIGISLAPADSNIPFIAVIGGFFIIFIEFEKRINNKFQDLKKQIKE